MANMTPNERRLFNLLVKTGVTNLGYSPKDFEADLANQIASAATLGTATPSPLGVAASGTSGSASREDHVHATEIPAQSGAAGKFLTTNGSAISWNTATPHPTYADLLASSDHLTNTYAAVQGRAAVNDGGQGEFYWDSTNSAADNGGTILKPTSVSGAGRWVRKYDAINPLWFPGADLGAQINAANAALGSAHGIIRVPAADTHVITTKVVLSAKRTLHLGAGWYDTSTMSVVGVFALNDDCTLKGDGWSTRIQEPLNLVVAGSATDNPGSTRWSVRDLAIIGDPNQTSGLVTSAYATIGATDGHTVSVTNVLFKDTQPIAFQTGADATGGVHGSAVEFCNNFLDGVRAINIAAVNAQNFRVQNCTFVNPGGATGAGGTCIDVEPNADNDVVKNIIISGNTFDLRGSRTWQGVTVQGHGPSGDIQSGPGVVANNTFIGEDPYGTITGTVATIAIEAIAMHDIEIANNVVQGVFSQPPVIVQGCTRATVSGNHIRLNGYTTPGIAILGTSLYTNVIGNSFFDYIPDRAAIGEDVTANYTYVQGNVLNSPGGAFGGVAVPVVHLQGANSVQAVNMIGGVVAAGSLINGLEGVYTSAINASGNIIGLTSALGPVLIRNNATPIGGTIFGIQGSTGTYKYLDITDNNTFSFQCNANMTTQTGVAYNFNTNSSAATLATLMKWQDNGITALSLLKNGVGGYSFFGGTASTNFLNSNGDGFVTSSGLASINIASTSIVDTSSTAIYPDTDNAIKCGKSTNRWQEVWSYQYSGRAQTVSATGAITVDPTQGETVVLTATGNVTSLTISAGHNAQQLTLVLIQDAGAAFTWPSTISGASLAGGSFTKTTSASAVDTLTFRFDGTKWREISRSLNQS